MHKPRRLLALASLALALAACDDGDKTPIEPVPTGPEPGVLRFNYSGARTGEFRASGRPAVGAPMVAYALLEEDRNQILIIAYRNTSDPRFYDDVTFGMENPRIGTFSCTTAETCSPFSTWVGLSLPNGSGPAPNAIRFTATSAQITIAAVTPDSIRGTFQMQMRHAFDLAGPQITVTQGEFNVPIVVSP
jgi:hypothetical protein